MALNEASFSILAALAQGPLHGYGILTQASQVSERTSPLKISTVYAALERLNAQGLIEVDREEIHDGRGRRYYRLTREGNRALQTETARYAALAQAGQRRLAALRPVHEFTG